LRFINNIRNFALKKRYLCSVYLHFKNKTKANMTITIETNKRSFINALVGLCKAMGISSYKVETTPKYNPEIVAAVERDRKGNYENYLTFNNVDEMFEHFGVENIEK
jgi:hypothetical protein